MAQRRPRLLSVLILLAYAACMWIWFGSSSTGLVGSIIFMPVVLAFGAGYGGGNGAFWITLLGQFGVIWWVVYILVRASGARDQRS